MDKKIKRDDSLCDAMSLIDKQHLQNFAAVAVLDDTNNVLFCSVSLTQMLGLDASKILHRSFASLFAGQGTSVSKWLQQPMARNYQPVICIQQQQLWFRKQKINGQWLIEIEPEISPMKIKDYPLVLEKLDYSYQDDKKDQTSLTYWLENIVDIIFHSLALDVVRIYQFNEDDSGRVVAEKKVASNPSYLHYHFPSTDVPKPVREFFEHFLYRYIPDILAEETLLIPADEKIKPLIIAADCRQVDSVHKEYLNNMGAHAAFTVPILLKGKLWGLLACQHRTAKYIHPQDRFYCRLLIEHFTMQLSLLEEIRKNKNGTFLLDIYEVLNEKFSKEESVSTALKKHLPELIKMLDAAGCVSIIDDEYLSVGSVPKQLEIEMLRDWLDNKWNDGVFYCDDLIKRYPKMQKFSNPMHGILAMRLIKSGNNALFFFREEVIKTIQWAGNPHHEVKLRDSKESYSPRCSFSAWIEKVSGFSKSWSEENRELANLIRRILKDKLLQQILQQKTYLDPLTQLFNRRYLNESIRSDVKDRRRQKSESCVAMIDVDDFKGINDRFGHLTGDKILKEVAKSLRQELRGSDIICRYGGDEFIAILNNCTGSKCQQILTNVLQNVRQLKIETEENEEVRVTLSIGISASDKLNRKLSTLISRADEALYKAKNAGKNQVIDFSSSCES